jgi:ClpP class serine protease
MSWLLRSDVRQDLRARMRAAGTPPTAEWLEHHFASTALGRRGSRELHVAGDVAEIRVQGVLTPRPDFLMLFFGYQNTTYADLGAQLAEARSNTDVKRVVMHVDSPGGQVAGLFEFLAALEAFDKPITVNAAQACSAAYAIAAASRGPITATTPAAAFGSIGVAASIFVDDDVVDITSTHAPNKRPDVKTPEGRAVVRAELDAFHELFVECIARNRHTTVERVNKEFGRGAVLLAGKALQLGMIDKLPANAGSSAPRSTASAPVGAKQPEKRKMDIETLKAAHPEVFAAVKKLGADAEHDRVTAHLTFAQGSGNWKAAIEDIKNRKEVTSAVQAEHFNAAMHRAQQGTRQQETDLASLIVDNAAGPEGAKDIVDLFADTLPKKSDRKGLASAPARIG